MWRQLKELRFGWRKGWGLLLGESNSKWTPDDFFVVSTTQREWALLPKRLGTSTGTFFIPRIRALLKGVITGVALMGIR